MSTIDTCPNCGERTARNDVDVLCQECYDSCPFDVTEIKDMEDGFKQLMAMFPKMQGE